MANSLDWAKLRGKSLKEKINLCIASGELILFLLLNANAGNNSVTVELMVV